MPRGRKRRDNSEYSKLATIVEDHGQVCICLLDGLCVCMKAVPKPVEDDLVETAPSDRIAAGRKDTLNTPQT